VSAFNGEVFVVDTISAQRVIDIFKPAALSGQYEYLGQITGAAGHTFENIASISVDGGDGDLYVASQAGDVVDELAPSGSYLGQIAGTPSGPFVSPRGLAIDSVDHRVFVGDGRPVIAQQGAIDVYGEGLTVPDVK